ncbi:unnamed protein product [Cylicocyclus nassatus]|uniref:Uncharacterized protein n=1 Tax=Cylicocyclus nassatus TaxID=53992 RepID=A0AA36DVW0_CYLNA|nr:unnamed protein product [Cylicocyclus nassatus]
MYWNNEVLLNSDFVQGPSLLLQLSSKKSSSLSFEKAFGFLTRMNINVVTSTRTGSAEKVRTVKPRAPKKDFITTVYHEDVVGEALQEQKKSSSSAVAVGLPKPSPKQQQQESDVKSSLIRSPVVDNRTAWAQNIITKRSIKSLAREFAANKKIKPADFTTEAYERNDAKNRYNDIICIDATRVVLKDRLPEDDYIHASWMTMPDGQKYICTQGPLLECVGDFWHMILTERSKVIVMLCNFNEGKHEKCCLYLPKEKKEVGNFGGFIVEVRDCKPDPFEGIKHTELDVKSGDDDGKGFIVHHLANFEWPDHTAPLNPAPTIGMFKLSRTLAAGKPITVHCSAGIGRSATFVAIDYAAQKIKAKADFSMVDVIRDLRSQRYQAIQSAIQYVYLHVCLLELFASDNALQRDSKFSEYMDSYVSMIKRYNKKVEAKQRERSRSEEK